MAFAAAFLGVFLLGGVISGVEFLELRPAANPGEGSIGKQIVQERPNLSAARDADLDNARLRSSAALRQTETAEMAVFQFLNSHFVQTTQLPEQPTTAKSLTQARQATRPNPDWVSLNRELASIEQKRSELLGRMTPSHPAVQTLQIQIAQLDDRIATTPADLPVDPPSLVAEATPNSSDANRVSHREESEKAQLDSARTMELQKRYRALLLAAGEARDSYRSALHAENKAWDDYRSVEECQLSATAGMINLLKRGPHVGGFASTTSRIPFGAIVILALLSLAAGIAAARMIAAHKLTFISAEEIEATLGLSTIGLFIASTDRSTENAA
jgi:hypothetical protein